MAEFAREEEELKQCRTETFERIRQLTARISILTTKIDEHPEDEVTRQELAGVRQELTGTRETWKSAGEQLAQLRSAEERRTAQFVNLADLPILRAGHSTSGEEDDVESTGHSSSIPRSIKRQLAAFPGCMVCGTTEDVSNAHILDGVSRDLMQLPNDATNFLRLCGQYRKRRLGQPTCHDLFDSHKMAFVHVHGADNSQWTVLGGTVETHGKTVTLATMPHRRALNARFRHAKATGSLQIPEGAIQIRKADELSESV
eukprot:TRINITY_DN40638_c0_g1_i1.p1 TRINITY_DN40638_c0_g1~~TRINITY_DN40638_c0_g1_i1.p1  ORF type:complete len:258 (+),score=29.17 TRINITY_DN40638_c0_g1_i1:16-789(+)